jgi:tellurite resistance protein|tara:strand:- start:95 stop:487 length:393 start_codon:yes stop_codon:yes gene_type:complete
MGNNFLRIALLSAISDGEIQDQESGMLNHLRAFHPKLKGMTASETKLAANDIKNKLDAGMQSKHIIEVIGESMSVEEKHAAYAIAKEICAADFKLEPAENDFLLQVEMIWRIPAEIKDAINTSIALRYFI